MSISEGFFGRPRRDSDRLPPGQFLVDDFPVLTAGPTPRIDRSDWTLSIDDGVTENSWTWEQFQELPSETITADIHCVTHWSKLDTKWEGVAFDTLLTDAGVRDDAPYALIRCYGGYTTNLPLEDLVNRPALVAFLYDGEPLEAEHGGPARLLVPHLYLWKSAKWINHIELTDEDRPGFWEMAGYHNYGDPWREERYFGD